MKFDRFGIDEEFCAENDYKIFFGVDWLSDEEYESFDEFFAGRDLFITVAGKPDDHVKVQSFSEAVKTESEFVDQDKFIFSPGYACIYVSDDRDIFVVASSPERIGKLISSISDKGGVTYSALVKNGTNSPKKQVKEFFDHWRTFNVEVS
ncbi:MULTISPECIES: hypothetical protein [unclassified Rhizobium]|uniref:hypothetical protein n=1 Tax=unclassified Rhizobium TaxID=2613769 RepID=UPI0017827559|nr:MULTISPECIES: hypothetical protein [unclassified Rhizobium]MBD8688222.1 hypothetical protein [Rhizobium sp. CFBP 13644]MBD8692677.1 hypothetical protein [Rhizobium sp. CFBP 13717]